MGVDDLVAKLELDVLDLTGDDEVLVGQSCFFSCLCRNDDPPWVTTDLGAALDSSL
jgi:hypothetical protein